MFPISQASGQDAPGLIDELVPGIGTVPDDIVAGAEDTVREPVVAHGHNMPQERRKLELHLEALLAEETIRFSARTRLLVDDLRLEWSELDRRIEAVDAEFAAQARTDETARLLNTIPGIGSLDAMALAAAIGNSRPARTVEEACGW